MHRDKLRVSWTDESGISHIDIVKPFDLRSNSNGEYMYARDSQGNEVHIRLDKIFDLSPSS